MSGRRPSTYIWMGLIRRLFKRRIVQVVAATGAAGFSGWIWNGDEWVPVGAMVPGWSQHEGKRARQLALPAA